jgi:hypothetical protein
MGSGGHSEAPTRMRSPPTEIRGQAARGRRADAGYIAQGLGE